MTKMTWADLAAEHEAWRGRYQAEMETPEYRARLADLERRRRENMEGWFAFAAAGGAVARNLQIALGRQK